MMMINRSIVDLKLYFFDEKKSLHFAPYVVPFVGKKIWRIIVSLIEKKVSLSETDTGTRSNFKQLIRGKLLFTSTLWSLSHKGQICLCRRVTTFLL